MLNQSADHALRAVLFVARQNGTAPCNAELIASSIGVPRNYLGKVLHTLTQAGVLHSNRGPGGGFRLAVGADVLTLASVVEPFQRLPERRACLLGNGACDPQHPCESHARWQHMTDNVTAFFQATTVATMLNGGSDRTHATAPGANGQDARDAK
jgi:Rrf2 family transcriptional regulator, iron-sulfur cluster assembly transcription factor